MKRLVLLLVLAVASGAPDARAQAPRTHVVQPGETLYRIASTNGVTVAELKALNGLASDTIQVGQRLRLPGDARPSDPTPSDPTPEAPTEPAEQTGPPPTDRPDITPTDVEVVAEPVRPVAPVRLGDGARPPAASGATPSNARIHTVSRGETLFRIALRYDTTVDALRRLNGIRGDQIEVGQQLVVSGTRPAASGAPTTLVRRQQWDIDRTTVPADMVHFVEPGETLYSIAMAYGFSLDALIGENAVTTAPLVPGTLLVLPERVDPGAALREGLPEADDSGLALVFPDVMRGRATAYGEAYDPLTFTASHRDLPYGTVVLVTNPANGRSTFVRIADRGPVSQAYLMELSAAAASALALDPDSAARVEIRDLP